MKETNILSNKKANIELQQKKKRKSEFKLISSIYLHKGHKLFELNKQGEIKEADYHFSLNKTITWDQALRKEYLTKSGKAIYKEGHLYCSALNIENAKRRFSEMLKNNETFRGKHISSNPLKLM